MLHFFHSVLYGLNILRIDITCRVTLNNFQHVIQEPFSLLLLLIPSKKSAHPQAVAGVRSNW